MINKVRIVSFILYYVIGVTSGEYEIIYIFKTFKIMTQYQKLRKST